MKDSLSSCSNSEEQEIQKVQKQAKTLKEKSLNKLNELQLTIQHLSSSNYSMYNKFRDAFQRLFEADERTFKSVLSQNMHNLERQLQKETLHDKDSNSDLHVIKVLFEQFIHSKVLEPSNYNSYDLELRRDFKEYTQMKAQTFKETIIQNINSIEQLGQGMNAMIKALLGMIRTSDLPMRQNQWLRYHILLNIMFVVDTQHSEQPECINNTCIVETGDSNVILDSLDMCDNDIQNDQNVDECDDERVALANLKLDVDENKKIQKELKKANTTLAQEQKECKSILAKTSRTLGESNNIRDSCIVALQSKQTEFEKLVPSCFVIFDLDPLSLSFDFVFSLVPSCFAIFDLDPLSLSFDFVFSFGILKSLSFSLYRLCHLEILYLNQHAHTLHHLESLLAISLDRLDILKEDLGYQSEFTLSSLDVLQGFSFFLQMGFTLILATLNGLDMGLLGDIIGDDDCDDDG
uniref:Uncharacterized protein n=1 Tax=Tanacetum cinerariifolium TaxID=118510 RepID=A0A6L2NYH6_TANCI|nr:hypothetical protein [Tanacetum cinerariifolium]